MRELLFGTGSPKEYSTHSCFSHSLVTHSSLSVFASLSISSLHTCKHLYMCYMVDPHRLHGVPVHVCANNIQYARVGISACLM